jgi:hypothetical protein
MFSKVTDKSYLTRPQQKLFETAEKVVFVSNIGGLPQLAKEKPTKKTRAMTFPAGRVRVGLIEELSTPSPRSDTELVKKVQDGLSSDRINEPSYMFINKKHAHVDYYQYRDQGQDQKHPVAQQSPRKKE